MCVCVYVCMCVCVYRCGFFYVYLLCVYYIIYILYNVCMCVIVCIDFYSVDVLLLLLLADELEQTEENFTAFYPCEAFCSRTPLPGISTYGEKGVGEGISYAEAAKRGKLGSPACQ